MRSATETAPTLSIDDTGPRRVVPYAREVVVIGAVFLLYRQVRFVTQDDGSEAMANAARLLRWEGRAPMLSEQVVQQLALRSEAAIEFFNRYYVSVHFPLTVAFLLWLLVRHTETYRTMRDWLIVTTVIALVVHIAFPLAPPRMLPGFVDTLRIYGPNIYPTDTSASMANQFAAMPSLHFGWSLIVAIGFVTTIRRRWASVAVVHPLVTLAAIVATGNHYFLDAAAAGVVVSLAAVPVFVLARRRQARTSPVTRPAVEPTQDTSVSGRCAARSGASRQRCPRRRQSTQVSGPSPVGTDPPWRHSTNSSSSSTPDGSHCATGPRPTSTTRT